MLAEKYAKDGLVVLAVNGWDESKAVLQAFVKKDRLKQRVLLKGSGVAERYQIRIFPTNIWVDRNGNIVDSGSGQRDLEAKTRRLVQSR